MPSYSYKAYDRSGALKRGTIEAESRARALEALVRRGEHPSEMSEGAAAPPLPWWQRDIPGTGGGLPRNELALFTRELATLLKASLPLDEALRILALQPFLKGTMRRLAGALLEQVSGGASLSRALARTTPAFPDYYWRLVEAGETTGNVATVMDELATSLERTNQTRAKVVSALVYPAVLVAAALAALAVIIGVLLPTLAPLFKDAGTTPPPILRFLLAARDSIASNAAPLSALTLALLLAALLAARNDSVRLARDRLALRLPVIGPYIARRDTAILTRTLGTLIRNGVPVLDSLRIAIAACRNSAVRDRLASVGPQMAEGAGLARPLRASGIVPDLALRLVAIGEETGTLDAMLVRAAATYESLQERQLERATTLIAPALTLMIGLMVGLLILSVMDAITSVNDLAIR